MPRLSDLRFTFTPASGVAFDVIGFTLDEALSETYRLCLELSSIDPAIDFGTLLDQPALFTIWRGEQAVRHVHGIVTEFVQADTGFRRTRYRLVVEPSLARAALLRLAHLPAPVRARDPGRCDQAARHHRLRTSHHL
ncbi:uncharacterized protein involved in type VI secretion and phage assembly [Achromobacter sp. JUb104]|nr:contractile injection system protein, VgrG/Pvc8 family [Achromobacter sp. JUb104]MCS3505634.1 uncharacterized protein involved in type VI secretion and phage assembly [Achromobacter sp. JUb104]